MAIGDVVFFDQWLADVAKKLHDHSADTFKVGLITSATTPLVTTADPRWGAGGSTNFSTTQVTPGGNYTTGGATVGTPTVTLTGGAAVIDGGDVAWAQNAGNPTNARWGILYNDTDAGKRAVAFVDLGSAFDMTTGPLNINWNAAGIATINQA
jgi:hypothetical protein